MTGPNRSGWLLTVSQQRQFESLLAKLTRMRGRHRPFLLTGDTGVGKTYLSRCLGDEIGTYHNVAQQHSTQILSTQNLSRLTPEAVTRFVKVLVEHDESACSIVDGFEPLVSMWAVERPAVLRNLFLAMGRAILDLPTLIVLGTSAAHLPLKLLEEGDLWPAERRFHLELTMADREIVARNWALDPMRARVSSNLYELLAVKLAR